MDANAHGFPFNPDVVNYCAWFCPEEKGFLDYRYHLFNDEVTRDFVKVRRALLALGSPAAGGVPAGDADFFGDRAAIQDVFRRAHVDHLIINGTESELTRPALFRLWLDPAEWTLLYMDGRTAVFGWTDSDSADRTNRYPRTRFDPDVHAFRYGLAPEEQAPLAAGQPELPQTLNIWERFAHGRGSRPLAADEVKILLDYAAAMNRLNRIHAVGVNAARCFGSLAGAAVLGRGVGAEPLGLSYLRFPNLLLQGDETEPAAIPILAVRAGLRAVADNSQDADAYLALAKAYLYAWTYQRDRWPMPNSLLEELREAQVVSALQHALTIRPNSKEAHLLLAGVYAQMNNGDARSPSHLDLSLDHRREAIRLEREEPAQPGETQEELEKRLAAAEEALRRQEQSLKQRQTDFELKSERLPPFNKAQLALQRGLAKRAVEILTETDATQLSQEDVEQLITLLLRSGRVDDVFRDISKNIPDPWNKALVAAALGDYRKADEYLAEMQRQNERRRTGELLDFIRSQPTPTISLPQRLAGIVQIAELTRRWAELASLRGLLALEAGRTGEAAEHFRKAFTVNSSMRPAASVAALLAGQTAADLAGLAAAGAVAGGDVPFQFDYAPMAARYNALLQRVNRQ